MRKRTQRLNRSAILRTVFESHEAMASGDPDRARNLERRLYDRLSKTRLETTYDVGSLSQAQAPSVHSPMYTVELVDDPDLVAAFNEASHARLVYGNELRHTAERDVSRIAETLDGFIKAETAYVSAASQRSRAGERAEERARKALDSQQIPDEAVPSPPVAHALTETAGTLTTDWEFPDGYSGSKRQSTDQRAIADAGDKALREALRAGATDTAAKRAAVTAMQEHAKSVAAKRKATPRKALREPMEQRRWLHANFTELMEEAAARPVPHQPRRPTWDEAASADRAARQRVQDALLKHTV